ncbi:MAG TPA: hypothetical protein VD884_08825 [Ohtaekwangia sp.]|nr:hypothetical protein [Ohtaekwangia sp.]
MNDRITIHIMNERSLILSIAQNRESAKPLLPTTMPHKLLEAFNKRYDKLIDVLFRWTS